MDLLPQPAALAGALAHVARGLAAATGREARVVSTEEELAALLAELDAERGNGAGGLDEMSEGEEDEDEDGGGPVAGGGSSSDEDASAASSSSSSSYAWTDADSLLLQQRQPAAAHAAHAPARSALCGRVVPVFPVSNVTGSYV